MPKPTSLDRDSPHGDRTAPRNVVLTRHPAPQPIHVGALRTKCQRGLAARRQALWPGRPGAYVGVALRERDLTMTDFTQSVAAEPAPAGYADLVKTQAERRGELRRMRMIATSLLLLMAAIFVLMRCAPAGWVWAPYLGAFAEAGMVGACADWFAVVALFRHPLGLPIPHTAVVPENKRRIGGALGRFITNNFLSPRVAIARLSSVDAVGLAARWLEDERNARAIAAGAGRAIPYALDLVPKAAIDEWVASAARRGIEAVPFAPLASRGLSILWAQGAGQTLLDQGLDFAETMLNQHKATIVRHVSQRSSRFIPKWVDDMIAAKVINGLSETLKEMREPDHPWRNEANALIEKWIDDLAHDPEMRAKGEALKREILANPVFAEQARTLWEEVEAGLRDGLPRHAEAIVAWLAASAAALGRWLEEDAARRALINRRLRLLALRAVLPRRAEIGAYIAAVVDNWDTATLVERLELQVGKDLQYIRINGTLVGGLVGLLIFTLSRAFGG
jgi:uncharacterized membrane-anchored protein YjiN (DUF445 family)